MESPYIDAYCHLGLPRFSDTKDALFVADRAGISNSVLVLGPDVPDYATLFSTIAAHGDRIRGVGIPFGQRTAQVRESVAVQLQAGVLGLRLEPRHVLRYPAILDMLGEKGCWAYAISVIGNDAVAQIYLDWLAHYPDARIAAPHFLRAASKVPDGLLRELIQHPRFTPVFSRHGGMDSTQLYPHDDFRAWVEDVIALSGWQNVMWGSEYPVIYWRDETMRTCLDWLRALLPDIPAACEKTFLRDTAQRLIFDHPAPECEDVTIPAWVGEQFNYERTLTLFPHGLDIPMMLYADLHRDYVQALRSETLTFAEYIIRVLADGTKLTNAGGRNDSDI